MMAARLSITIEQGATFELGLVWQDPNEDPVDLTGYTARAQVRRKIDSTETILDFSSEGPEANIELGGEGTIALVIDAETTAAVDRGGVWDLELEDPDGVVTRLVQGRCEFSPEVTRD